MLDPAEYTAHGQKSQKKKPVSKFLEKFDPKNMQKTCFMFNKIEELLLFLLVLFYLKGLKMINLVLLTFTSTNLTAETVIQLCSVCSLYLFAQYVFQF